MSAATTFPPYVSIEPKGHRVPRTDGNWIRTYTGLRFWPLNPAPEDVAIEDIAHALSMVCRFAGHVRRFYSVADHSLRVSTLVEQLAREAGQTREQARDAALWGLLHDGSEAYFCDVPSPVKRSTEFGGLYRQYEKTLMDTIALRFGLVMPEPAIVKQADVTLLNTEMRDLMRGAHFNEADTLSGAIRPIAEHSIAEALFLRRFNALIAARRSDRALRGL